MSEVLPTVPPSQRSIATYYNCFTSLIVMSPVLLVHRVHRLHHSVPHPPPYHFVPFLLPARPVPLPHDLHHGDPHHPLAHVRRHVRVQCHPLEDQWKISTVLLKRSL